MVKSIVTVVGHDKVGIIANVAVLLACLLYTSGASENSEKFLARPAPGGVQAIE